MPGINGIQLIRAAQKISPATEAIVISAYGTESTKDKLEQIGSRIKVEVQSKTDILNVSVTHVSPEKARDLANAVVYSYKDFSYHKKKLESMSTREFLEQQLGQCHNYLRDAEVDIKSFKESRKLPDMNKDTERILNKATSLEQKLEAIQTAISELASERERFINYPERDGATGIGRQSINKGLFASVENNSALEYVDTDALNQLNNRLFQLQLALSDQLRYYKSNHPQNQEINNRIREKVQRIVS